MGATLPKALPGVSVLFSFPCLGVVLAATATVVLQRLGLPLGGAAMVALSLLLTFKTFSFIFSRLGRRFPLLEVMRDPFSTPRGVRVPTTTASTDIGASKRRPKLRPNAAATAARSASAAAKPSATSRGHRAVGTKGLRVTMPGIEIYVNSELPTEFENDFFKGRMLFLLNSVPPDPKWGAYFEGKNRAFEMQIQGQLKSLPKGEVYMGGELEERPKQGLVTQTVSKIVMSFAKQMVRSLHYSFGEKRAVSEPLDAQAPHVTFPLYRVMDWFVVTPPNETPPPLGKALPETLEDQAARRSGRSPDIVWSTEVTYTMCFHSNMVNFQEWAVISVPGQGSLDLNMFLCKQPVSVVVYDFLSVSGSTSHRARDKQYMFRCTISNDAPGHIVRPSLTVSSAGWSATRGRPTGGVSPRGFASDDEASSGNEIEEGSKSPQSLPEGKNDVLLGLIKSGDVLPLLVGLDDSMQASVPRPSGQDQNHPMNVAFLGEGNRGACAAMRRESAMPAGLQIVKVGGGTNNFRRDYLYAGDVVILHNPESRKFMRVGRAWVLGWSSKKASTSKIHFVMKGIEAGSPLAHGQAFTLSSRRWPSWEVGVERQESSKVGGKVLRCINRGKSRNVARYHLLTLAARSWLEATSDLGAGGTCGVIPALEAESDAITISVRSPFEDVLSAGDEADAGGGEDGSTRASDGDNSDGGEITPASDPERSDPENPEEDQRERQFELYFGGNGLATKASRAMRNAAASSLKVSISAWVELLHRGRQEGQLAFMVAVRGVPAASHYPISPSKLSSKTNNGGDDLPPSPSRSALSCSWTCLRTGRDLSGVVTAHRESVENNATVNDWQPEPRPRVISHMSTADQSVRLISHELSEIQRREAAFRDGNMNETVKAFPPCPATPRSIFEQDGADCSPNRTPSPQGTPCPQGTLPPQGTSLSKANRSISPVRMRWHPQTSDLNPSAAARTGSRDVVDPPNPAQGPLQSLEEVEESPSCENREGVGEGLTLPYRMLCETVSRPGKLDRHFLSGSSASDLGVAVTGATNNAPLLESAVARCLWESHWREEWAVLFPSHVACFPPLSKKPVWVLPIKALHKASAMSDARCPFPGLHCLRLETIGRAHYVCFATRRARDGWLEKISRLSEGRGIDSPSGLELGQDPREIYVLKTKQWRMPPRLVLNARRPGFDLPGNAYGQKKGNDSPGDRSQQHQHQPHPWQLSADALRVAYSISAEHGDKRMIPFLDLTCKFRRVDLCGLNLNSGEALCFFANLYHLVVRHMLLVLGPPSSSKVWSSSYRDVSYEVGNDVFSLQELEHCVLRGRLPRPNPKELPKRFAPLPPEGDDHYMFSLKRVDARMSMFLNNASESNSPVVVLLSPEMIDEQLNRACQAFVEHTFKTDAKRKQIRVHKAVHLYAKDLHAHATPKDMIRYGLCFVGSAMVRKMSSRGVDISQAQIRYHPYRLKCHETMSLIDLSTSAVVSTFSTSPSGDR
ncbi:unnamed protein product [Ascophyllum nodosum]